MTRYLDTLTLPASGAWAYARIPKTGTHSVLAALHRFEFDCEITTPVQVGDNTSDDMAPHLLDVAGVFMSPLQTHHAPEVLTNALRFTLVRNPVQRAVSGFRYLCRSHETASRHLAPTRLRISAATGLDWNAEANTAVGLEKMVRFVEASLDVKRMQLDGHIAPQTMILDHEVFKPYMTGRTEDMGRFLTSLSEELGVRDVTLQRDVMRNTQPESNSFVVNNRLRTMIEMVFAADMEWYESV